VTSHVTLVKQVTKLFLTKYKDAPLLGQVRLGAPGSEDFNVKTELKVHLGNSKKSYTHTLNLRYPVSCDQRKVSGKICTISDSNMIILGDEITASIHSRLS